MSKPPVTDRIQQRIAANSLHKYTPIQLAFWSGEKRAVANELARCALFLCGSTRKPRRHYDNEKLFSLGSGTVTYSGEELRSLDEDVFLALAHAARSMPSEDMVVKLSNAQICKLTGRFQSQRYYNDIYKSIQRLKGGVITVYSARLTKALACERAREEGAAPEVLARLYAELAEFERREELNLPSPQDKLTGLMMNLIEGETEFTNGAPAVDEIPQGNLEWTIKLNKKLVTLFAESYLTLVDFEVRKLLSPGARRLQAYFCSHRQPNDVLVISLAELLGLELSKGELNRTMQRYLDELVAAKVLATGELVDSAKKGEKLARVTRSAQSDTSATENDTSEGGHLLKTTHRVLKSTHRLLTSTHDLLTLTHRACRNSLLESKA